MPDIQETKPPKGSEVQSVLFSVDKWTIAEAKKWLKDNKFSGLIADKTEEGDNYRFRQHNPDRYKRFRTMDVGKGIKLIVGFTKIKKAVSDTVEYEIDFDALAAYMERLECPEEMQIIAVELLANYHINDLYKLSGVIQDVGWQINQKDFEINEVMQEQIVLVKQEGEREKEIKDRDKRVSEYKIAVKQGGNLTMPKEWRDMGLTNNDFADPVNYRYPIHDASHTRNASARWGDENNRKQYNSAEQKIITDRIDAAKKKFKIGEFKKSVQILQKTADKEERLVYGVVLEPQMIDTDNQWTDEENIKEACHTYMKYFQDAGVDHNMTIDGLKVVENFIAPQNLFINGEYIKKGSWVMAHYVDDDETWERILNGELNGYSLEGIGALVQAKPEQKVA